MLRAARAGRARWRRDLNPCRRLCRPLPRLSATPPSEALVRASPSGRRDSNPRPSPWQGDALPTEPRPHCSDARSCPVSASGRLADARARQSNRYGPACVSARRAVACRHACSTTSRPGRAWFAGVLADGPASRPPTTSAALDEGGWWAVVADVRGAVGCGGSSDVRPTPAAAVGPGPARPDATWTSLAGPSRPTVAASRRSGAGSARATSTRSTSAACCPRPLPPRRATRGRAGRRARAAATPRRTPA